jgi:hypothetical protein
VLQRGDGYSTIAVLLEGRPANAEPSNVVAHVPHRLNNSNTMGGSARERGALERGGTCAPQTQQ